MSRLRLALLAFVFSLAAYAPPALATEAGWALLRDGGRVVLLVHGRAPGTGDPANFDVENCRTQRNLSEAGRQQARRLGALFAARAAPVATVYSSRYCRALDTARLAFGDSNVEAMEALDSFENHPEQEEEWTRAIVDLIGDYTDSDNMVLVTHQPNILALTGTRAREGEAIIVAPAGDGIETIGRIVFN